MSEQKSIQVSVDGDVPVFDHEYKNNIAVTKYENGVKVYVNYGSDEVNIDGLNISSEDFLVVKEG